MSDRLSYLLVQPTRKLINRMQKLLSSRIEVQKGRYVVVMDYWDRDTDQTGQIVVERDEANEILGWLGEGHSIQKLSSKTNTDDV